MQGFGNVGGIAARELARRAALTVVAVSDVSGGVYDERGLDSRRGPRVGRAHGSLEDYPDASASRTRSCSSSRATSSSSPRARTRLTARTRRASRRKLVAEGANGPTSLEADAILAERGIVVLPDMLTNAGGVTVSYFEWVQDLGRLFWDRDEIRASSPTS